MCRLESLTQTLLFVVFSREYLPTTLDASVPSSGQQPASPYSEQHPSDGPSTGLPELLSDLRLAENVESVSEESVIDKEVTLPDEEITLSDEEITLPEEEITLPDEEKTRTHDEQSDGVSASDEQSVSEESVPDGEIMLPDHSRCLIKKICWKMNLLKRNFLKYFLLLSQNLIQFGVKISNGLLERSKTKLLRTCPGEGC